MPHLAKYITTRQGKASQCNSCKQEREKHCVTNYYRNRTIEMVDYNKWIDNVRIAVSDEIDDGILYDYIRRGCIEFAKRTKLLQRNVKIALQEDVADYYPCVGEQERIDNIQLFALNGVCYEAIGDTCTWHINGYKYWFYPPHSLEIHPAPKKANHSELILTVITIPREDSEYVDKLIFDRYFHAIESYAIAQAMMLPLSKEKQKEAPHPSLIPYRMNEFNKALTKAKIDIARNYSTQGQRW